MNDRSRLSQLVLGQVKLREDKKTWLREYVREYVRFPFQRDVPVLGKAEEMLVFALCRWPIRASITSLAVFCGPILLVDYSANDQVWFLMKPVIRAMVLFLMYLGTRNLVRGIARLGYAAAIREMRGEDKLEKDGDDRSTPTGGT